MSMSKWINSAVIPAYGIFKLRPKDFEELTIREFNQMVDAYQQVKMGRLWENAYWVSNLMSIHTKKPVLPKQLMKAFFKEKSIEEIKKEREEFFDDFEKQRKEERNE